MLDAKKRYEVVAFGERYQVTLHAAAYASNGALAIEAMDYVPEWGCEEPFATLSVNLPDFEPSGEGCFFLDTNNCPWAAKFLADNDIARPTGKVGQSGFCTYPEYKLS